MGFETVVISVDVTVAPSRPFRVDAKVDCRAGLSQPGHVSSHALGEASARSRSRALARSGGCRSPLLTAWLLGRCGANARRCRSRRSRCSRVSEGTVDAQHPVSLAPYRSASSAVPCRPRRRPPPSCSQVMLLLTTHSPYGAAPEPRTPGHARRSEGARRGAACHLHQSHPHGCFIRDHDRTPLRTLILRGRSSKATSGPGEHGRKGSQAERSECDERFPAQAKARGDRHRAKHSQEAMRQCRCH